MFFVIDCALKWVADFYNCLLWASSLLWWWDWDFVKLKELLCCYFFALDLMKTCVTRQMEHSKIQLGKLAFIFKISPTTTKQKLGLWWMICYLQRSHKPPRSEVCKCWLYHRRGVSFLTLALDHKLMKGFSTWKQRSSQCSSMKFFLHI